MTDVYQCDGCKPSCFLVAPDDDVPKVCPFSPAYSIPAKWRQIQ